MKTKELTFIAVFTAITIIFSQINISLPFSPVPLSMSIFAVFLCGAMLNKKSAAICQTVYLLLGAVGLPVFSHFGSGLQMIAGPTGGYILSYPIMAFLIALTAEKIGKTKGFWSYVPGMVASLVICYSFGSMWMSFVLKIEFLQALIMGVLPFLVLDMFKIVAAASFGAALNRVVKMNLQS